MMKRNRFRLRNILKRIILLLRMIVRGREYLIPLYLLLLGIHALLLCFIQPIIGILRKIHPYIG